MSYETSYDAQVRAWSNTDLLDVARHIDKDAFPERTRIIQTEIERRKKEPAPDIVPPPRPSPSKYATFWRRVGAILLDGLILMPVTIGAQFLAPASTDPVMQSAPGFLGSLLFYLYSILLHGRNGQTIGKMAARVRVVDLSEEKLTMAQAITRDLVPLSLSVASFVVIVNIGLPIDLTEVDYASLIPGLFLLSIAILWSLAEILTMATNRKRRAIHDFIAGSVVVRIGRRTSSLYNPAKPVQPSGNNTSRMEQEGTGHGDAEAKPRTLEDGETGGILGRRGDDASFSVGSEGRNCGWEEHAPDGVERIRPSQRL